MTPCLECKSVRQPKSTLFLSLKLNWSCTKNPGSHHSLAITVAGVLSSYKL